MSAAQHEPCAPLGANFSGHNMKIYKQNLVSVCFSSILHFVLGRQQYSARGRSGFLSLLLPLLFLLVAQSSFSDEFYAHKPEWWDGIEIKLALSEKNIDKTVQDSWKEYLSGKNMELVEGWHVIGPFSNFSRTAYDNTYPTEKLFDPNAVYEGKDGIEISWKQWKPGEKPPIPQDLQECIFFLYKKTDDPLANKKKYFFTNDDNVEIFVNGKSVYKGGYIFDSPENSIYLKKGLKNGDTVLVKLENFGHLWDFKLFASEKNIIGARIKLLCECLSAFSALPQSKKTPIYKEIFQLYFRMQDLKNAFFWARRYIADSTPENALRFIKGVSDMNLPKGRTQIKELEAFFSGLATDSSLSKESRESAFSQLMELLFRNRALDEVSAFFSRESARFDADFPMKSKSYRLKLFVHLGNYDSANILLKELQKMPEAENDRNLKDLARSVEDMVGSSVKLRLDWDFDSVMEKAAALHSEGAKLKLAKFARDTISAKSEIFDEGDLPLHRGAAIRYKEGFSKYSAIYDESLNAYLELLKKNGIKKEKELAIEKNRLSLSYRPSLLTSGQAPSKSAGIPQFPSDLKGAVFRPFAEIMPGVFELWGANNVLTSKKCKVPPASISSSAGLFFMQNSRQILCSDGKSVKWWKIFDNFVPEGEKQNYQYSKFEPLFLGGSVVARLCRDGKFGLFCFDVASGRQIWEFHSPETSVCSDPIGYGESTVVIVKKGGLIAEYQLAILSSKDASLEKTLHLFSCPDKVTMNDGTPFLFDFSMPRPKLDSGLLYILSNYGAVFCVDMESASFAWAFKYPRIPFSVSRQFTEVLSGRICSDPVCGTKNVLVAPMDSSSVFLLDKLSGSLVGEKASMNWSSISELGDKSALIIAQDGLASSYSLENLSALEKFCESALLVESSSPEGAIIRTKSDILQFSSTGKNMGSLALPPNFQISALIEGQLWGYLKDSPSYFLGRLEKDSGEKALCYTKTEKVGDKLQKAVFHTSNSKTYLSSENYVSLLDDKFSILWSYPSSSPMRRIFDFGKFISMFTNSELISISPENARTILFSPRVGEPFGNIIAPYKSGESLIFARRNRGTILNQILRQEGNAVSVLGEISAYDLLSIFNDGKACTNAFESSLITHEMNKNGAYVKSSEFKLQKHFASFRFEQIGDGRVMFYNADKCSILNKGNVSLLFDFKDQKRGWRWDADEYNIFRSGVLSCMFSDMEWNVIDTSREAPKLISENFSFSPAVNEKFVAGICGFDRKLYKCQGMIYGRDAGKFIFEKEADLLRVFSKYDNPSHLFSALCAKVAVHAFAPSNEGRLSDENAFILQNLETGETEVLPYPYFCKKVSGATGAGDKIALVADSKLITIGLDEIRKFGGVSRKILEIPLENEEKEDFSFDGYPDEWDPSLFAKCDNGNSFAGIYFNIGGNKDYFAICLIIKDKNLLKLISRKGPDSGFSISVMPAGFASLIQQTDPKKGFFSNFAEIGRDGGQSSFFMHPSGEYAVMELKIPKNSIFTKNNWHNFKEINSRSFRGDIAFDFSCVGSDGKSVSFFSAPKMPASPAEWPAMLVK